MDGLLILLGIFIGIPLLLSLPGLISNLISNFKYKRRLKRIKPDLILFDIESKRNQYLEVLEYYKSQQKDLISDFRFKFEKNKKTIGDFIQQSQKTRSNKKKPMSKIDAEIEERIGQQTRKRYWY